MKITHFIIVLFFVGFSVSVFAEKVACGGLYSFYEESKNGNSVCTGGQYTAWHELQNF